MLAANIESAKYSSNNWSNNEAPEAPASVRKPAEIKIEQQPVVARHEEEEAESDLDAEYDDEIESEFEDSADFEIQSYSPTDRKTGRLPPNRRPLASQPPLQRKRSHDEASDELESQEAAVTLPEREGTPPKRARLDGRLPPKQPLSMVESPPLRQRKRSSEELEDHSCQSESQGSKRVKA